MFEYLQGSTFILKDTVQTFIIVKPFDVNWANYELPLK